jgi:hypothetical protein
MAFMIVCGKTRDNIRELRGDNRQQWAKKGQKEYEL